MSRCIKLKPARISSLCLLTAILIMAAAIPCEGSGLFSLGVGYSQFKESSALLWDPSWHITGTYFYDVRPGLQLGLIANYYFIEARSASELFGVGVYWDQPQGDSWMFSLLPAVRVPFALGEDGATQVYLQGGFGWYHLDMDVLYSGTIPFGGGPVEKRVTEKWDKPGIDGRFGVITRLDGALFLEISPGISVIFTDDESTWSLSGYIAMGLKI